MKNNNYNLESSLDDYLLKVFENASFVAYDTFYDNSNLSKNEVWSHGLKIENELVVAWGLGAQYIVEVFFLNTRFIKQIVKDLQRIDDDFVLCETAISEGLATWICDNYDLPTLGYFIESF